MDWFLYDRDLRHETVKGIDLKILNNIWNKMTTGKSNKPWNERRNNFSQSMKI